MTNKSIIIHISYGLIPNLGCSVAEKREQGCPTRETNMIETMRWTGDCIEVIDQTLLPGELVFRKCRTLEEVCEAIENLRVRGAPAIGIAGAFGVVVAARTIRPDSREGFLMELDRRIHRLASTRPTAVNLFWALDRMRKVAEGFETDPVERIPERLLQEALEIQEEDKITCRRMGLHGAELLKDGMHVLTHCNAGGLATADYGTALGVIYAAKEQGKRIHVYADETRPLLQGARLTAWELTRNGIEVTLICDSMAAWVMRRGMVDCVITGADRITRNGDVANKIGTYGVSVAARAHGIPFYVAAPFSTVDMNLERGEQIPIEERGPEEITFLAGSRIAPEGVSVYNPAFDVTPQSNVTAIVTEKGIARAPYGPVFDQWAGPGSPVSSSPSQGSIPTQP